MPLLNKDETKALLDGIWNNKYDQTKLPYWLFSKIADGLEEATEQGWGNKLGSGSALKDLQLEESLRKNVYYFAAHKTEKELAAFHELYKASANKYNFVKEAVKLNEMWNYHWYNTEYNVTTRLARAGRDWRRIEETKEYYPMLRFLAVQDANTRAEHAALHNIVRSVDDPFWEKYFPPLSWNCRCRVERMQTGTPTYLIGKQIPEVKEQFQARVTDSKKIWNENHPYFQKTPKAAQKVIEQMVAQKIVEKKTQNAPYNYKSKEQFKTELTDKFKNIDVSFDFRNYDLDKEEWNYIVGKCDITRALTNVDNAIKDTIGENIKRIKIEKILDQIMITAQSENVYISRTFKGGRIVEHDTFKISPSKQGKGTSKRVLKAFYDEYKIGGIKRIDVGANLDVGGYTWGKYGFSAEKFEVENILDELYGEMAEKANRIVSKYFTENPKSKTFPMNLLANSPGMKEHLLGRQWYGSLRMNDKVQTKIFEDYINGN